MIQQYRRLVGLTSNNERAVHRNGKSERPNVIALYVLDELPVLGAVHIEKLRPGPHHEELANFFFRRHPAECAAHPRFARSIQMRWPRSRIAFFRRDGIWHSEKVRDDYEEDREMDDSSHQ